MHRCGAWLGTTISDKDDGYEGVTMVIWDKKGFAWLSFAGKRPGIAADEDSIPSRTPA
jgi:hypothetical protein